MLLACFSCHLHTKFTAITSVLLARRCLRHVFHVTSIQGSRQNFFVAHRICHYFHSIQVSWQDFVVAHLKYIFYHPYEVRGMFFLSLLYKVRGWIFLSITRISFFTTTTFATYFPCHLQTRFAAELFCRNPRFFIFYLKYQVCGIIF